jgi:hypothetical protein
MVIGLLKHILAENRTRTRKWLGDTTSFPKDFLPKRLQNRAGLPFACFKDTMTQSQ